MTTAITIPQSVASHVTTSKPENPYALLSIYVIKEDFKQFAEGLEDSDPYDALRVLFENCIEDLKREIEL